MSFAQAFKVRSPDAYERLILDVIRGNQTLFMRRDEVEAAWAWIEPILAAWRERRDAPKPYAAGTWGPSAALSLIERWPHLAGRRRLIRRFPTQVSPLPRVGRSDMRCFRPPGAADPGYAAPGGEP